MYAHSAEDPDKDRWQPLANHLEAVAILACCFASKFGAGAAAALSGLLHDLGKYSWKFQRRLEGGAPVDHATAGAQTVVNLGAVGGDAIMVRLIAYAIAGHHGGLDDTAGLADRLKKSIEPLDPRWKREIVPNAKGLMPDLLRDQKTWGFQLAFLGRMIFSCLIDADRRDTAAFEALSKGLPIEPDQPRLANIIDGLIVSFDREMASKSREGAINALRWKILEDVRRKAAMPRGLFTLTVPTGGGKTLASLGFALDHAKKHELDRIIYAIPFTSIIDQTADIFSRVLGEDVVLAHHAGLELAHAADEKNFTEDPTKKLRLAMATWDVPVVVTTNVQFFESLFSHRPSRCRKLHDIARSVIVLDEAQTIPLAVLRPCLAALNELQRNYGCSIVLCTATQPAVLAPRFQGGLSIEATHELAPDPHELHRQLKRVTVRHAGIMTDAEVIRELAQVSNGLVIVNTRAHALKLFRDAQADGLTDVIHLTTRQYADHRRAILADIRDRLHPDRRRPCRVIATSLVEAGVDLDFFAVWRAEAGLDSIAQAAGRCNREGKRTAAESIVTVFTPADVKPPREIQGLIGDMGRAIKEQDDLLSLDSIKRYFEEVYWRKDAALDRDHVLDAFGISGLKPSFRYREVGENFKLIENGLAPVIIARDERAKAALAELRNPNVKPSGVARKLQPFIVQVPPKARKLLFDNGHVAFESSNRFGDQFCVLQTPELYDDTVGLLWENPNYLAIESFGIF